MQENNNEMSFGMGHGGRNLLSVPAENQIELSQPSLLSDSRDEIDD